MTISRRFFLTTSCGAAVAVAASPLMMTKFISTDQSSNRLIKNIIVKRFPKIDFSGTALDQFADMMANKDRECIGNAGECIDNVLDDNVESISFDRYVMREFVLNTNYLKHKSAKFPGLEFKPFKRLA